MGNLGDAVSALLDTYSRCLSLLKKVDRDGPPQHPTETTTQHHHHQQKLVGGGGLDDSPSSLASALRKARASVTRSYSSGIARRGSAFEKGDAKSRKSLRQVLRRLAATMAGLGAWFSSGEVTDLQPNEMVSYSSLVSLCNASHTDAVRAMTNLSSRIGSQAGSRAGSRASIAGTMVTTTTASAKSKSRSKSKSSKRPEKRHSSASSLSGRQHARREAELRDTKRSSKPRTRTRARAHGETSHEQARTGSARSKPSERLSWLTISSASTKLGEVRGHGRRHKQPTTAYPRHSLEFENNGSLYGRDQRVKKRWWQF